MILETRNQLDNVDYLSLPQIQIGKNVISYVKSAMNLDVVIDDTLTCSFHVLQIVKRIWFTLRQIRHSKVILSMELRRLLIIAVFCLLIYL